MNLLLLGASGYIGSALAKEIEARGMDRADAMFVRRSVCDYTDETKFRNLVAMAHATHVINAACFIPPNGRVDDCRNFPSETWESNVHFPAMLARVCNDLEIMLCHISTGCLYDEDHYYEEDELPTRWKHDYAGLYVNTKWYGEVLVRKLCPNSFVWRIRLPFDEVDHPRNFLTKIQKHNQVWEHNNSLTHRGDFVRAAIDMIERGVDPGVYNMVNPFAVKTRDVIDQTVAKMMGVEICDFVDGPVPGTLLSTDKLQKAGIFMRSGPEAVTDALNRWRKA
jgi:dTDP-4-dehydrorhamnose reductase